MADKPRRQPHYQTADTATLQEFMKSPNFQAYVEEQQGKVDLVADALSGLYCQ